MSLLTKLSKQAQQNLKTIILPEGEDERVLSACHTSQKNKIAKIILLGDKQIIADKVKSLKLNIGTTEIIAPKDFIKHQELLELLQQTYKKKNKAFSQEQLQQQLKNPLYFANLYLQANKADGCVVGCVHSTADVLRCAFSILGTKANTKTISGVFIIINKEQIYLFADCAVVVDPSVEQLKDIAISTAQTAKTLLNTQIKIAMLSFSTYASGKHPISEKISQATALIKQQIKQHKMDFIVDGELQLDAAICEDISKIKAPNSPVKGQANVLIFPDLNSGNIGYKLVQRLAGAKAIGPILQGIAKPVNDLSRGASVEDIVNMIIITANQANSI